MRCLRTYLRARRSTDDYLDTVEVRSSSLLVPTIFQSLTSPASVFPIHTNPQRRRIAAEPWTSRPSPPAYTGRAWSGFCCASASTAPSLVPPSPCLPANEKANAVDCADQSVGPFLSSPQRQLPQNGDGQIGRAHV